MPATCRMSEDLVLRIDEIGEENIPAYVELSQTEYGDAAVSDPDHLRWKYLRNPQGRAVGVHLFNNQQLIGRMAAVPRTFESASGPATAAYIVDLVVHHAHRGMNALLMLMNGLKTLMEGFDFLLVTPNESGIRVWQSFVRVPARFDFDAFVAPLRPLRLLGTKNARSPSPLRQKADAAWAALYSGATRVGGLAPGFTLDSTWPARTELDDLFHRSIAAIALGRRDAAFLEWRFRESPRFRYDMTFIRKRGQLVGYLAGRRMIYQGYDVRLVIDVLGSADLTPADWRRVGCGLVAREGGSDGADMLMILGNASCGTLAHLAKLPFLRVPRGYMPQPATVFAEWRNHPARFDFTAATFALTLADCDMF